MPGQGAARRSNAKRAQLKRAQKKAAKRAARDGTTTTITSAQVPMVTEDDLLAFQLSHFGDDTKPQTWFVDGEVALEYDPTFDDYEKEDDGLGFYEDGVKRTLTDDQIEMFRHSEIEWLIKEGKLERDDHEKEGQQTADGESFPPRPGSGASSVESELVNKPASLNEQTSTIQKQRDPSESTRSEALFATGRRLRREEIPYEERHKRKWEDYIEENDAEQGSLTHRRIARELDEQKAECLELDY